LRQSFSVSDEGDVQPEECWSTGAGFIRRRERSPRGFACDIGRSFFAIGENACRGGGGGSFDHADWLPGLAKEHAIEFFTGPAQSIFHDNNSAHPRAGCHSAPP
jgi:hypothetical protein